MLLGGYERNAVHWGWAYIYCTRNRVVSKHQLDELVSVISVFCLGERINESCCAKAVSYLYTVFKEWTPIRQRTGINGKGKRGRKRGRTKEREKNKHFTLTDLNLH